MFKNVVVALDGSPCADHALALALELAKLAGSKLAICCVADPAPLYGSLEPAVLVERTLQAIRSEAQDVVTRALAKAEAAGVSAQGCTPEGEPVYEIGEYAKKIGADGVVIGTHGRSGVRRLFMGSIAEGVMRHSTVPLIAVREEARIHASVAEAVS